MLKKFLSKVIVPITISIICGFISGKFIYNLYMENNDSLLKNNTIYLIESADYQTYDTMRENSQTNNYIYYQEKGTYKTVVGITKNQDNIKKISQVYDEDLKVSKYYLNDTNLNEKITNNDNLLSEANSNEEIKSIINETLSLYKENNNVKLTKINWYRYQFFWHKKILNKYI